MANAIKQAALKLAFEQIDYHEPEDDGPPELLVAWPEGMQYTIEKASAGFISSFTSGEGLVCRFRGPGRVLIQTRNPSGFGNWVMPFLPTSN